MKEWLHEIPNEWLTDSDPLSEEEVKERIFIIYWFRYSCQRNMSSYIPDVLNLSILHWRLSNKLWYILFQFVILPNLFCPFLIFSIFL